MSRDHSPLQTLERWRNLQLEDAQARHSALQQVETDKRTHLQKVQQALADVQLFARGEMTEGRGLSPDALQRTMQYVAVQTGVLKTATDALKECETATAEAHAEVVSRSEDLFGVERLRERHAAAALIENSRREQRQLDDLALLRVRVVAATEEKKS